MSLKETTIYTEDINEFKLKKNVNGVNLFYGKIEDFDEISYLQKLDDEEKTRFDKFKFTKDKKLYLYSHITLKNILRNIIGTEVKFSYTRFGKPYLEKSNVDFNISKSNGHYVIAVSGRGSIGIYFSEKEKAYIKSEQDYFKIWTRKEALLKTNGLGIQPFVIEIDTHLPVNKNSVPLPSNEYFIKSFPVFNDEFYLSVCSDSDFWIDLINLQKPI